jgi:acetyltransferase-like isoleucine patch superfamily enzyme
MALSLLVRKFRSALLKFFVRVRTAWFRCCLFFWGTNVKFGKNFSVGRNVIIKTIAGRIFIADNVHIDDNALLICEQSEISIGADSYIGIGVHIVSMNSIKIGSGALIAAYCIIRDMNHGTDLGSPMFKQQCISAPVQLGDDVWLGAHAVVTAGVKINDSAIIGANAVVTHDIPNKVIAVGLPARPVKSRQKS